jgi:hypothetical protein
LRHCKKAPADAGLGQRSHAYSTGKSMVEFQDSELYKKSAGGIVPPAVECIAISLKAELRPKCSPQVVMCAVVEENVVSDLGANSNRPSESLDAATWIDGKIRSSARQRHAVGKSGSRGLAGDAEIIKSDFAGRKMRNGPDPV